MAIYGRRQNKSNMLTFGDILINPQTLKENNVLVFSESKNAFVNRGMYLPETSVHEIVSFGGNNDAMVYSKQTRNTVYLKYLEAGSNIVLHQDEQKIRISAETSPSNLSVLDSLSVIIDSDNNSTDAKFEVLTAASTSGNPIEICPLVIPPIVSDSIYTGVDDGFSYVESRDDIDFIARGFEPGMRFSLQGTDFQDGEYQIMRIDNFNDNGILVSRLVLADGFDNSQMINLGGPKETTTIIQADLFVETETILSSYSVDFGPSGFDLQPGMIISISGTQMYNGTYQINDVLLKGTDGFQWSSIILEESTPLTGPLGLILEQNPLKPTTKITVKDFVVSTGFSVGEDGTTSTTDVILPTIGSLLDKIVELENRLAKLGG